MEQLYALGVSCIQLVQEWLHDYEWYFEVINDLANPHHMTETLFPLLSILDSVFASQLLLCMAFGGWLNAVMKWWFLEDRPYWWVRETTYYSDSARPRLLQTRQTCETGPGSPSGHSSAMALALALTVTCAAHVARDRKWHIPSYIQKVAYVIFAVLLGSVLLARMYVAAHFPHQCILGAIVGLFLGPALCIYVSDPYIWRYGRHGTSSQAAQRWHIVSAFGAGAVAVLTYLGLTACKHDPQVTVKLAFRWCEQPEHISVSTTPIFALVQCTAYLLGWAVAVTPAVAQYRHDTKNRSLIISAFATSLILYGFKHIDENLCRSNTLRFYVSQFVIFALKPMLLLRVVPAISMWPFSRQIKVKSD